MITVKVKYNEKAKGLKSYDSSRVMTLVKSGDSVSTLHYRELGKDRYVNVSCDKFDVVRKHRAITGEFCCSENSTNELKIQDIDVASDCNMIKIEGNWWRASNYRFIEDGANVDSEISGVMV